MHYDIKLTIAMAIFLSVVPSLSEAGALKTKPLSPLSITIQPGAGGLATYDIASHEDAEFIVEIRSFADLSDVIISVELSKDVKYISGDMKWEGPLTRNSAITLRVTVKPLKIGKGRITVRAKAFAGKDVLSRTEMHYDLDGSLNKKLVPKGRKSKDNKGRDIIEYELK